MQTQMCVTEAGTLAEQLRNAQAALREAKLTARKLTQSVKIIETELANTQRFNPNVLPTVARSVETHMIISSINGRLAGARSALANAEKVAGEKQVAVDEIRNRIRTHPLVVEARKRQREMVEIASEISEKACHRTKFFDVPKEFARLEKISNDEVTFLLNANIKLREAGLPEVTPILPSCISTIVPLQVFTDVDFNRLFAESAKVRQQMLACVE